MVAGELRDPVVSNQVDPAVPDVSQVRMLVRDHQRGAGRSHSATTPVTVGAIHDHMVGLDDRHFESLVDGEIRSERAEETLPDGLRGQLTGYPTAGCTAQAVG